MSVQRKSIPAREADLESTAELPVLDVHVPLPVHCSIFDIYSMEIMHWKHPSVRL